MGKKVSVIIPVYKAERTIERCVRSIVEGDYQNIEIILVDDCSPDRSYVICRKLEKLYDNIIVIQNKKNQGVSYTRNQGLKYSTGTYLMFVDSDDWVEKDFISTFVDSIDGTGAVMSISGYINHDEVFNAKTERFGWNEFSGSCFCKLNHQLINLYHSRLLQQLWNKIFLLECVRENKIYFDESISMGEDFRFILNYLDANHGKECVLINRPLYHYMRDNGDSLMTKCGQEKIEEPLFNFRLLYELMEYPEEKIEKLLEEQKRKISFQYGYAILHNDQFTKKQKIKLMQENIGQEWKKSYKMNKKLLVKEKINSFIHRNKKKNQK